MKEGLIYISDRLGQLRYSDKDENNRWLQPLSSYKALKPIKRGQAVSVATNEEIKSILTDVQYETYESDPSPYIVPTNTKIHNRCIGLALENAVLDGEVHILSSGQFEYDNFKNTQKEYDPKFTIEEISKKVYVSDKEGELTTSSEVAYENYNNIIQIGHIIDAPKDGQNKTILEVQIQGDDRGVLESTQFEVELGEDVYISKDEPLTVFAFGQEEASKFKLKLCTRNMNGPFKEPELEASFIIIKKLSGEYSIIKFSDEIHTDDNTDLSTLKLLKSRYTPKNADHIINNIDFIDSSSSIETIIKALNEAIKEMGAGLSFNKIESSTSADKSYSNATLELNEDGGYYDIYYSNSLKDFLRDTATLQNGSLFNKNKAVLADIRVDARKNVFGVLVNKSADNIELKKKDRILLMRQGELVVNSKDLTAIGKRFVLGENGSVICADDALRTADSSNTIGYLKKVHGDHYHFVIDIGENIPKVEYSTYPVGYLKPYFGSTEEDKETPDFGYLVTGRTYPIESYKELYERLLGWYDEVDINRGEDSFEIPKITDSAERIMQIKYVTDGIFERLPKVPYLRDFGDISETEEHACGINKLDITALLSINTTFSEVDTLPLENLDIHLYIDPGYTKGEHNWREVRPGFYKYNNVDTYGFEWKIEKLDASEDHIYGQYILSADIGDSRGIYYTSDNNVAPISCINVPYKLYVAVKQTNIEHFDLRNLMSNYISNTIYNESTGDIDKIYAVTGSAVVNAIRNNEWFNVLKNETRESVVDFGGTKKLNTNVNIQTDKAIKLNCTIESEDNSVLIGETVKSNEENTTKNTTLEIKDGKAFLNKLNEDLFAIEGVDFVNAGNEVATINDVLDHALMSIDKNVDVKETIVNNKNFDQGRIHGMVFGKDGNIDASTLCSYNVCIAYGQDITDVPNAIIPIIYKDASGVHTPLQGNIDYYTFENESSKKLFTLYPSYETESQVLDLKFTKDTENNVEKISFGGAKLVAETELPSLSKYKTIYSENKFDRNGQFTTKLADNSTSDDVSFDFAYILQAAYELPMAYWKYRDSDEYNIGPIIERLQDTIKYFENEDTIEYEVDGEKHEYTEPEKAGIAKSLKDIISESGKSVRVDDMVGFLLAAAGETQKRLASLERSTYGKDVMADVEEIKFPNMKTVTPGHTHLGLNRLVRAICLELFKTADPGKIEEFGADENTQTSLSRIDDIERQIRGSIKTPDEENGSIANNSINNFGSANAEGYSISNSYPYEENITEKRDIIDNENIFTISDKTPIDTKETIFGNDKAKDTDSFNGVVDAIYRITQKVDVLTEAINGTNDILQPHTTLNKIKRNIETLIKEVYFDGENDQDAYKDILSNHELFNGKNPSRVDEITKELYEYVLEYKNCGDTQDETKSEELTGYKGASYNSNDRKLTIESPNNIAEYKNISIIDIILKAIGNQILLKQYSEQDGSAKDIRFNKDISQRLYNIEQCLDKVVLRLKDSTNFENFTEITFDDENTTLNIDEFSEALSRLLGYKYHKKEDNTGEFLPSKGVVPNTQDNSDKFSAEYALSTKSNIVAGLENLLYRVQNEEKDNCHIKSLLGEELMGGVSTDTTEKVEGTDYTKTPSSKATFTLSDDIKDLLATIYGEAGNTDPSNQIAADDDKTTYYTHRTLARKSDNNGSFLNGGNIIENIVNELYYIPKPLDSNLSPIDKENLDLENDVIYVNHNNNVNNNFFTGSLIDGNNRNLNFKSIAEGGRKSRLDILESDIKALRKFIGLTGILDLPADRIDAEDKKKVAIEGNFSFSQSDDGTKYFVNNGYYEIGKEDNLQSSFINSFFNLMKRVDGLDTVIGVSDTGNNTSLNGRISTVTNSVSKLEADVGKLTPLVDGLKDTVEGNNGLADTVASLNTIVVGSSINEGLREKVNTLKNELDIATKDVADFKVKAPLVIKDNILNVAAQQAMGENFTVTGNQHIYILPKDKKTYYCNVSFILDPDRNFIGRNKSENRKNNINTAIKQTIPPYLFPDTYNENPTWLKGGTGKENTNAHDDDRAYIVYNRKFSNMLIDNDLSMGTSKNGKRCIYCGITDSSTEVACKGNVTKVGCIVSDLVVSENGNGKQYSPFYFELEYVTPQYGSGEWKFSWEVQDNTGNN